MTIKPEKRILLKNLTVWLGREHRKRGDADVRIKAYRKNLQ